MNPVRRVATWLPQWAEADRFNGGNRVATGGLDVEWQPGCQQEGAEA
jgi:hypothetical protein